MFSGFIRYRLCQKIMMTNKYIERLTMPITHHQLPVTHDGCEELLVKLLNFRLVPHLEWMDERLLSVGI